MDEPTPEDTRATRAARWLQPTPAELAGVALLVLGAVVASVVIWIQATHRPTTAATAVAAAAGAWLATAARAGG